MSSAGWAYRDWVAAGCGEIVKVWNHSDPRAEVKIYEGTSVYSIAFSRNNRILAVAGDKGQIHLHSSNSSEIGSQIVGTFPQNPEVGTEAFCSVVFALNGQHIAAGTTSGIIKVWDLTLKGSHVSVDVTGLTGSVTSIAAGPSTDMAATSSTGQVMVFDLKTGTKLKTLARGSEAAAGNVCYNTAGSLLAYGNAAGAIAVWDAGRWERTRELVLHKAGVTGLAFSDANGDQLLTCGHEGVLKCTDLRTRKDAWSVTSRQPYTALSAKHNGQLVAVGNAAGCVLIHDVRNVRTPVAVQQFSNSSVPVSVVRWQHYRAPKASSSAASVATSTLSSAAEGLGTAAASRQQQQQPQSSVLQTLRRPAAASGPSQAAEVGAADAPVLLRSPGRVVGKGSAGSALEPEASNTSMSASMDFSMRAFSPVHLGGDEAETDDAATSAPSRAPAPAAAAGGTPEMATPSDSSMLPVGHSAPFMFTPGIGLGLSGGTTPTGLTATTGITPISRPAGLSGAAHFAPAATAVPGPDTEVASTPEQAAAAAAPVAAAAAATGRLSRRDSSSGLDSRAASSAAAVPAATSRPLTAGRASLQSAAASVGVVASVAGGGSGNGASAAAPGAARSFISRQNSSSSIMGATTAANGSRPISRAGSISGAASASAGGLGSRRSSSRGLQDATEPVASAVGVSAAADARLVGLSDGGKAADGSGARPSTAGAAAAAGMRDEALKEYINQQMEELRVDVRNMHMDMLRQFHQAQMDLVSVVDGLAQRQDQLAEAICELTTAVQGIRAAKQLPGTGGLGMMPWI